MKILYFLSGTAVLILLLVILIARLSNKPQINQNIYTPTISNTTTTNNPSTKAPVVQSNKCIITISGMSYDITNYQNGHSGGNVFVCGTDMTGLFWGRHSQREMNYMQQFKI